MNAFEIKNIIKTNRLLSYVLDTACKTALWHDSNEMSANDLMLAYFQAIRLTAIHNGELCGQGGLTDDDIQELLSVSHSLPERWREAVDAYSDIAAAVGWLLKLIAENAQENTQDEYRDSVLFYQGFVIGAVEAMSADDHGPHRIFTLSDMIGYMVRGRLTLVLEEFLCPTREVIFSEDDINRLKLYDKYMGCYSENREAEAASFTAGLAHNANNDDNTHEPLRVESEADAEDGVGGEASADSLAADYRNRKREDDKTMAGKSDEQAKIDEQNKANGGSTVDDVVNFWKGKNLGISTGTGNSGGGSSDDKDDSDSHETVSSGSEDGGKGDGFSFGGKRGSSLLEDLMGSSGISSGSTSATGGKGGKATGENAGGKDTESGKATLDKIVTDSTSIQKLLHQRIFGQDQAIDTFAMGYFQSEIVSSFNKDKKKPKATFLFAGPPGVGKTFLAENVAEALDLPYRRFDMSEYSDKEANFQFCGSDGVYKGSKGGNVTTFVDKNPKCVLLFDEVEKAHLNVIYLFLQILDAGRIRDNYTDKEVSFSDAIIIFTTNAGKSLYEDTRIANLSTLPRKRVLKALGADINPNTGAPLFPPAILSRFASGNVVMFNHLNVNFLFTIAKRELDKHLKSFTESSGIKVEYDPKVPSAIILSEGGRSDARTVTARAKAFFHDELYELFRLIPEDETSIAKIENIRINVSLDGAAADIASLFECHEKWEVLVFASPRKFSKYTKGTSDVVFHVTDDFEKAKDILFTKNISAIYVDVFAKPERARAKVLNAEDVVSAGRDFMNWCLPRYDQPISLVQYEVERQISEDEFVSFAKLGISELITVKEDDCDAFHSTTISICEAAYRQKSMLSLAKASKVVGYQTAQSLENDGKDAVIDLFNFKLTLAQDSEEGGNILDNISKPDVRFDDVIGAEDAKEELRYFVNFLKDPAKYMRKGVKAPKGVLLWGPPGTGKTMLAKAMAAESDVTFITAEGNQFIKSYIGEGSQSIHKIFETARKYAPSILFIDEIDAIAKNRASKQAEHTGDVLTALLTEMDGFNTDTSRPVFVLAATNYDVDSANMERSLDPAMLRRFDRRIFVDLPTKEERCKYIRMKTSRNQMVELTDDQIENIAIRSIGMSLAELDSIFELATRSAIRRDDLRITYELFDDAFETFLGGEKREWKKSDLLRTARHEAGHALMSWLAGNKPTYVTIVSRGDHGGYMLHADEDKGVYTKDELLDLIAKSLGGRAAEIVYYGERDGISTGPSSDLAKATGLCESMITRYGMDEKLGLAAIGENYRYSPMFAVVTERINEILNEVLEKTIATIEKNRGAIDALVDALLETNKLQETEIDEIFSRTAK